MGKRENVAPWWYIAAGVLLGIPVGLLAAPLAGYEFPKGGDEGDKPGLGSRLAAKIPLRIKFAGAMGALKGAGREAYEQTVAQALAAPPDAGRFWLGIMKETAARFGENGGMRRGAALSYYTMFSIAPLLLVAMSVVGIVMGQETAQFFISGQLERLLGPDSAATIQKMIAGARSSGKGAAGTIGLATLLFSAGAVVTQIQTFLNDIWGSPASGSGLIGSVKDKVFSLALVLAIGFLLLLSLLCSAALAAVGRWTAGALNVAPAALQGLNLIVSLGTIAVLFATMFKMLPRVRMSWRDVWIGATFTAALFVMGNFLLALYLGIAGPASAYGAAGSVLALMAWAYYCAQIFFFGAEFTYVYARRRKHAA